MRDCAGRCARGVQRRARQVEWLLLPASTWKVAHEAACIYHAMQTSGPRDELRIPTLRPIALGGCCGRPCRLNPRFEPPHAEAAYREHTKEAVSWAMLIGTLAWFVLLMSYLILTTQRRDELDVFPELESDAKYVRVMWLQAATVFFDLLGIALIAVRHWLSPGTFFVTSIFLAISATMFGTWRLVMYENPLTFVRNWGANSMITKMSPAFFSGFPFAFGAIFILLDSLCYNAAVVVYQPVQAGTMHIWTIMILPLMLLLTWVIDSQRRREFVFKCDVYARKQAVQEVASVYSFLAENTTDILALHDMPAPLSATATSLSPGGLRGANGEVHETHLVLAAPFFDVRDTRPRFRYISPACARVLGWRPEELASVDPFILIHPEDRGRAARLYYASPDPVPDEERAWLAYFLHHEPRPESSTATGSFASPGTHDESFRFPFSASNALDGHAEAAAPRSLSAAIGAAHASHVAPNSLADAAPVAASAWTMSVPTFPTQQSAVVAGLPSSAPGTGSSQRSASLWPARTAIESPASSPARRRPRDRNLTSLLVSLGEARARSHALSNESVKPVTDLVFRVQHLRNVGLLAAAANADIVLPADFGSTTAEGGVTVSVWNALGLPVHAPRPQRRLSSEDTEAETEIGAGVKARARGTSGARGAGHRGERGGGGATATAGAAAAAAAPATARGGEGARGDGGDGGDGDGDGEGGVATKRKASTGSDRANGGPVIRRLGAAIGDASATSQRPSMLHPIDGPPRGGASLVGGSAASVNEEAEALVLATTNEAAGVSRIRSQRRRGGSNPEPSSHSNREDESDSRQLSRPLARAGLGDDSGAIDRPPSLPALAARIRVEPRASPSGVVEYDPAAKADLRRARTELQRFLYDAGPSSSPSPSTVAMAATPGSPPTPPPPSSFAAMMGAAGSSSPPSPFGRRGFLPASHPARFVSTIAEESGYAQLGEDSSALPGSVGFASGRTGTGGLPGSVHEDDGSPMGSGIGDDLAAIDLAVTRHERTTRWTAFGRGGRSGPGGVGAGARGWGAGTATTTAASGVAGGGSGGVTGFRPQRTGDGRPAIRSALGREVTGEGGFPGALPASGSGGVLSQVPEGSQSVPPNEGIRTLSSAWSGRLPPVDPELLHSRTNGVDAESEHASTPDRPRSSLQGTGTGTDAPAGTAGIVDASGPVGAAGGAHLGGGGSGALRSGLRESSVLPRAASLVGGAEGGGGSYEVPPMMYPVRMNGSGVGSGDGSGDEGEAETETELNSPTEGESAVELRFRRRDGRYTRLQVTGNPTALGLVCVYRRVTVRSRRASRGLRPPEPGASGGEHSSSCSHEE